MTVTATLGSAMWRLGFGGALVVVLMSASACTKAEAVDYCPGGTIIGGECVADGSGSAFADTSARRQSDGRGDANASTGGGASGPGDDPGGDTDDTGNGTGNGGGGTDGQTDEPDDGEWDCTDGLDGTKPVGAGCERHCECHSGYCYDEAYLGDFRFCTLEGAGGCNALGGQDGVTSHTTLNLNHSALSGLELTRTIICQPICASVADCASLSTAYDKCGTPTPTGTHWGPVGTASYVTLSLQRTCQIAAEVESLP